MWSLPYDRLIAVIHARPKLASHAPKVKMTITNINHDKLVIMVNIIIKPRIIASNASRVIKR